MYHGARILGVVPAPGGSKGIPHKNIRRLAGEPLIGYTLRTASRVAELDRLVVSTDDLAIAAVVRQYGVEVIDRPAELATDTSATEVALLHALDVLETSGHRFDILLVLEPTSPLRSSETIMNAIAACVDGRSPSVLAVRETRENLGFISKGVFCPVVPNAPRRRQDRQPMYVESSTIYACRVDYLRRTGTLVAENWGALVVPEMETVDINTEDDLQWVEFLLEKRRREEHD